MLFFWFDHENIAEPASIKFTTFQTQIQLPYKLFSISTFWVGSILENQIFLAFSTTIPINCLFSAICERSRNRKKLSTWWNAQDNIGFIWPSFLACHVFILFSFQNMPSIYLWNFASGDWKSYWHKDNKSEANFFCGCDILYISW